VFSVLAAVMVGIAATSKTCPVLSSEQAAASAAVRSAACGKNMDLWSKGGR
jgi:hypothetical protein